MENFTWYVAGPWDHRAQVREVIAKIQAAGWKTNSRWADADNPDIDPNDPEREKKLRHQATRDIEDVAMADGLIYVNSKPSEGKATEFGLAVGMLKPIVIIGSDRGRDGNIFLNLNVPMHNTIEEALEWLASDKGKDYIDFVLQRQLMFMMTMSGGAVMEADPMEQMEFPSE